MTVRSGMRSISCPRTRKSIKEQCLRLQRPAFGARTDRPEVVVGVNSGVVAVAPVDPDGVAAPPAPRPASSASGLYIWNGDPAASGCRGGVPCAPVQAAQGHSSRRYWRPYSLRWPSFQSILMPFDLEMAMCSGSVAMSSCSVEQALHVAHAGDAAHGRHQLLELLLVAHVHRHLDHARRRGPARVLASRLRMFVFSPESTVVSWFSMPGRSSVWTTILHRERVRGARGPTPLRSCAPRRTSGSARWGRSWSAPPRPCRA